MFVDKLYFENDINTFYDQNSQYPQVVLCHIKDIDTQDITRMHKI